MARIFVSYRRDDAPDAVGRMVDGLETRFGEQSVFVDVDDIPYGADFRDRIRQALSATSVMLVVIGPNWLEALDDRGRRLDNPDDPVRAEVASGLRWGNAVLPVLVQGARMPRREELPEEIRGLADINAVEVRRDPDFRSDMERLAGAIEATIPDLDPDQGPTPVWRRLGALAAASGTVLAAIVIAIAILLLSNGGNLVVPAVAAMPEQDATATLRALGMEVAVVKQASADIDEGIAIKTVPDAGAPAPAKQVTLFVSTGPEDSPPVPDVREFSEAAAITTLQDYGYVVDVERETSSEVRAGEAIRTDPVAGTTLDAGSPIVVWISDGQPPPVVPPVVGERLDDATRMLTEAGLAWDLENEESSTVAAEAVIRVDPGAGTRVPVGSSVLLVVSSGPPANEPPTVVIGGPYNGVEGRSLTFDASSSSDTDGNIESYTWDFGDGATGSGAEPGHIYEAPGRYTVTLSVGDDDGSVSVTTTSATIKTAPIFRQGDLTVRQTWFADLDGGLEDGARPNEDFWFRAVTATERYVVPQRGAEIAFIGPAANFPSRTFCENVELSENAIPIDQLAVGTYVCLSTNEGRPAAFEVLEPVGPSPGLLKIRYVVWES